MMRNNILLASLPVLPWLLWACFSGSATSVPDTRHPGSDPTSIEATRVVPVDSIPDTEAAQKALAKSMEKGKEVYSDYCIACHLGAGEGVAGAIPPLAKSDYLLEKPELAIRAIKLGQEGEIVVNGVTYDGYMGELGLSDEEVADVMNYISNSWENKGSKIWTAKEVKAID